MIFTSDRKWQAKFIECEFKNSFPVVCKKINVKKEIKSVTTYVCGLGLFEFFINGKKASKNLFEPGETNFDKKAYYSTYDITDKMHIGENDINIYLGKGFYHNSYANDRYNRSCKIWGNLMLICEIVIEYNDGNVEKIGTDNSWRYYEGEITECSWLGGEDYDANIKPADLKNCKISKSVPFEKLVRRSYPPIITTEKIYPVKINKLSNGDYVIIFQRNFAGIYTFTAYLKKGTKVTFKMGEMLYPDGSVDQRSCVMNSSSFDTYIADGSGLQSYTPKFVYHAGEYMQISGLDFRIIKDMIIGYAISCSNKVSGIFKTSNNTVNKIHSLVLNSVKDNMQNVITDCPHREKLGWIEQTHLLFDTFASNFDVKKYYEKIIQDIIDAQKSNGSVPSIVPPLTTGHKEHALKEGFDDTPNDPSWCGAIVFLPYYSYLEYGDIEILKKAYLPAKKYIDYLISLAEKGSDSYLLDSNNLNRDLGDWVSLEYTDVSFVVSCVYYQLIATMDKICNIINKSNSYLKLAENIKNAINSKYYNKEEKQYIFKTQTANALPLYLKIAPEEDRHEIAKNIVDNVISHSYHLTCGEIGIKPLLYVLSDYGYTDVVYKMIMNDDMPSYKYFVGIGKTTLPESWDAKDSWSKNHCMLGIVDAWFYRYIGGIKNVGVSYNKVKIEPHLPPDINFAEFEKATSFGSIKVILHRINNEVKTKIIIPKGIETL